MKEYFTVKETSKILGLEEISIRTYITKGIIRSEKVLNSRVIPRHEIIHQIKKRGLKTSVKDLEEL